jgi:hypothetical protein
MSSILLQITINREDVLQVMTTIDESLEERGFIQGGSSSALHIASGSNL